MRRFTAALAIALTLGLFITGCDSDLTATDTEPETTPKASQPMTDGHGATGTIEATVTYRTVDTEAAEKNGFTRVGEKIGTLSITDDGSDLDVTGEASGLKDDDKRYISLFYDKASPAQGPEACEPGVHNEDHPLYITGPQMIIGPGSNTVFVPPFNPPNFVPHAAWVVDGDGDATLNDGASDAADGALQYVPVDKIGTVSIRDLTVKDADLDGDGNLDPGAGPEAVVACGVVTHAPEGGPPSGS